MGMMKRFLMEKIAEFALIHGKTEEEIYTDDVWYALAEEYANTSLKRVLDENE